MDPQKITELAKLLRNNGDKILTSEFKLTLSGALLRALNDSFTLIADSVDIGNTQETFQVVKPINSKSPVFRDLQLIHDFVQKTSLLCIVHFAGEESFNGSVDIRKFRALKRLEVHKTNIKQIIGIQPLRSRLQHLVCVKSLQSVEDVITRCGGDNSNGFVWNELKIADFSYNNLQTVDTSLEFAQYLQHLNLRHNKLKSVSAIKWLPHLKSLDLSFNCLQSIPQFHAEACKRLQSLNMSNNFLEDIIDVSKLDALLDLDLSDNCLMEHSSLLPLSALMTLSYLNLYGNPLHCHPKHRLATAQYLHKNTATVKFVLDFEPLNKSEKALTGKHQSKYSGSLNRFMSRSSSSSINTERRTPSSQTPASSLESLRSFKFPESSNETDTESNIVSSSKKRSSKVRTVQIQEPIKPPISEEERQKAENALKTSKQEEKTRSLLEESNEHLEAKKQIDTLRKKYGAEWLQTATTEMISSVTGVDAMNNSEDIELEHEKSRQLFQDYLGEFSNNSSTMKNDNNSTVLTSTPTNDSFLQERAPIVSPIKPLPGDDPTVYISCNNNTTIRSAAEATVYKSADSGLSDSNTSSNDNNNEQIKNLSDHNANSDKEETDSLHNVYVSENIDDEPVDSEPEDDEEPYIVSNSHNGNENFILTISSKYLREKDSVFERTLTKWSLQILQSCERIKSNHLKINFDTVKKDKMERTYKIEDGLCQELEKRLRTILADRDLSEMNIVIYRCVNCTLQFTRERNNNMHPRSVHDISCPNCKSQFVAEITDLFKTFEKTKADSNKVSPAVIVEEQPAKVLAPIMKAIEKSEAMQYAEDTNSIGSANSLNGSSSCSRISRSQNSFDSNESVVGSSNTDRENEFQNMNTESDVDIISNPSQSSIEVLEQSSQYSSRKTSEERRISHAPNLATIDDQDYNYTQSFIEREFGGFIRNNSSNKNLRSSSTSPPKSNNLENFHNNSNQKESKQEEEHSDLAGAKGNNGKIFLNLTESSSSGSVTDSICTSYEQQQQCQQNQNQNNEDHDKTLTTDEQIMNRSSEKMLLNNLLDAERSASKTPTKDEIENLKNANNNTLTGNGSSDSLKREDSGISSMFGAIFQSTNILMSSSKKLLDAETSAKTGTALTSSNNNKPLCQPYKFNYSDFRDVDHRLKLYFYQTKFEEAGEHFKWIVKGQIYNENTNSVFEGIVVMSTCKCYIMEAFATENDDVTSWLKHVVSVTVDRLESIQLLPWKIGLSFELRGWGRFSLILQDILRTDSLLLHFANDFLPSQCDLIYQPSKTIVKRLGNAVLNEQLKMLSILSSCEISFESAKRRFGVCSLLATDSHIYLTSNNFSWLSLETANDIENDMEVCMTQLMSNLVDVERPADNVFLINFLDETHGKCELWKCNFETKENAESCLSAIAQSWEKLFGVPLLNA